MSGLGSTTYATNMIIAKGLGPRATYIGQITTPRWYLLVEKAPPRPNRAFGGGPYPGKAWNVVDKVDKFYQPVDKKIADEAKETPFYQVPMEKEREYVETQTVNVIMKARIGNKEYEKIYSIHEKYAPIAVSISNFANVTYKNINILAENIKRVGRKATFIIENFRPKKDDNE